MRFILLDTIQTQPDNLNDTVQEENLYQNLIIFLVSITKQAHIIYGENDLI